MGVEGFFQVTFINIILYIFFNVVVFYNRKSCSCIYLIETEINETFMFCPFSKFTRYVTDVAIGTDKY